MKSEDPNKREMPERTPKTQPQPGPRMPFPSRVGPYDVPRGKRLPKGYPKPKTN